MKRLLFALALILITAPSAQAGAKFNVFTDAIDFTTTGTAVAGDVTAVGDCTSNACFTGSSGTKITGDTSSNLEIETANTFNIDTGADGDNFTILHNGNVGIGTTAPGTKFTVSDGTLSVRKSADPFLSVRTDDTANRKEISIQYLTSGDYAKISSVHQGVAFKPLVLNPDGGNVGIATTAPTAKFHVIQTGAADAFRVDDQASDTTPFVVDQAGNVGIGTSAPIEELHVNGDIIIPHTGKLKFRNNEDTSSIQAVGFDSGENMYVGGSAISQTYFETGGGIGLTVGSAQNIGIGGDTSPDSHLEVSAGGTTGGAIFQLSSDDGNDGDLLTALENGNVGIGTTAPSSILAIDKGTGYGQVTADGSSGGCLMFRDTDDAGWTECTFLDGVMSCSTDADGTCDGS